MGVSAGTSATPSAQLVEVSTVITSYSIHYTKLYDGFRARCNAKLPVGAVGSVILELGEADWSVMAVTVLRLGSQDRHIALMRIDYADLSWRKFVNA